MRVRVVISKVEMFVSKFQNIVDTRLYFHARQGAGFAAELQLRLFDVVAVQMHVAESVYKIAGLETAYLRYH